MDDADSAEEELEVVGVQDALKPGCRAPAHLRKRVERGEQGKGVKEEG